MLQTVEYHKNLIQNLTSAYWNQKHMQVLKEKGNFHVIHHNPTPPKPLKIRII